MSTKSDVERHANAVTNRCRSPGDEWRKDVLPGRPFAAVVRPMMQGTFAAPATDGVFAEMLATLELAEREGLAA